MRRAKSAAALIVAVLVAAPGLTGCGGNSKPDYDPPAPPPATTPAPAPKVDPPVEPEPKSPPPSKFNGPGQLALAFPANPMQTPPSPTPSGPPTIPGMPPLPTPPMPATTPPPPTPPDPKPMPEPKKEFEWPLSINGLPMSEYIKDVGNPDPAKRETALRMLPNFGPAARKAAGKEVLAHMDGTKESDPGVKAAAFEAAGAFALLGGDDPGFEDAKDTDQALVILRNAADRGAPGGGTRLHAVQTIASFGRRAEGAISTLTGGNMTNPGRDGEPAYTTRQAIANALGQIAFNPRTGPSQRALYCLTDVLIKDPSAAVRLAAYQSIVILGPPLEPRPDKAPLLKDLKENPKTDDKAVAGHITRIKARLAPWKAPAGSAAQPPPTGLVETDKQVEIFARLALMRLDPKEANDENFNGIAKYINAGGTDTGPKLMALSAIGAMGDAGARRIDEVAKAMSDENPNVASMALSVLVAMGPAAKPYLEVVEKLKDRGSKKDEKEPKDYPNEYWAKLSAEAVKAIKEAKARPLP